MSILVGATSACAGAAGQGPSADLGDTIDQSLRFNNGPSVREDYLQNTNITIQATSTFSGWIKIGGEPGATKGPIFGASKDSTSADNATALGWAEDGRFYSRNTNGDEFWDARFRDYSAWYHLVLQFDSSLNMTLFVNNVQQSSTKSPINVGSEIIIGRNRTGSADEAFQGYMAALYYVDGSILAPTSFGKYNEDGVWVPQDYTGSYGTNGFKLVFDSSAGIGDDSSGNGNDFTASGFDTGDVVLYSKDLTGSGSTYESDTANRTQALGDPYRAFDTDSANGVSNSASGGGFVYFNPETALTGVTGVRILFTGQTVGEARINGSTVTTTTSGNYRVLTLPSSPMTVNEIAIRRNQASTEVINYEIDQGSGFVQLVDNTDNDVDYLDTPTSNYATWSPLSGGGTLTNANLGYTQTTDSRFSTQGFKSGDIYAEFTLTDSVNFILGLATDPNVARVNGFTEAFTFSGSNTRTTPNATEDSYTSQTFLVNDVIGIRYNATANTAQIYRNGTQFGSYTSLIDTDLFFGVDRSTTTSSVVLANYGQMPFVAAPDGITNTDNGMQTNNLPEPTIKNGKDHFNAVIWDGDDTSPRTIDVGFEPDLVWIKSRPNATSHFLYDSVRGFGASKELSSNNQRDEGNATTNTAGSGYVSDTTSTGFTVEAGTLNDAYVNDGVRDYVGWCWKAGGTAVSNTDGTITSSVSANTDAGFSIVSYTGVAPSTGTVGHGLSSAPECVLVKDRSSSTFHWQMWHTSLSSDDNSLLLNQTTAEADYNSWQNTAPTNSVVSLGAVNGVNTGSNNYIMYCWHAVEGYSKFGSYTGDGSTDGPFIYLGFTPSLIICKCSSTTGSWRMFDSARSPNNVVNDLLLADTSGAETTTNQMDFISNGFKIRSADNDLNGSGRTFVYMAWAESPFGGENAPPATAR